MVRPTYNPVFEEQENIIKDRIVDRVPENWRKEPGDFMYDAVAATPEEVKLLQVNQDNILKNSFAIYAEGEYLDYKLDEVGLVRFSASPNRRTLSVLADAGVTIPAGHTIAAVITDTDGNPIEYTTDVQTYYDASEAKEINVTCKTPGTIGNLAAGSTFTIIPPISGVRTVTDLGTDVLGQDQETDNDAWERYDFKVKNPDTGGNKNDYKRWALEVLGIGDARVLPRWNGNGTVKVVLVDTEYQPATPAVVDDAQTYLDPESEGLGNGKAPCGARVTVVSADALPIDISATVTYTDGYDPAAVKDDFVAQLTTYLKGRVFTGIPIVYNKIGSMLIETEGVSNYSDLLISGGTSDIMPGTEEAPIVGQVTI